MLKPDQLQPPETLIELGDGSVCPLMFFYAVEGDRYDAIAADQGFKIRSLLLVNDADNQALADEWEEKTFGPDGDTSDIIRRWQPKAPEGWMFGGKHDTEDGPVAFFLCRLAEVDAHV